MASVSYNNTKGCGISEDKIATLNILNAFFVGPSVRLPVCPSVVKKLC
jgi:hypothetical protein